MNGFMPRYILRHIRRSIIRSALAVLIAALTLIGIGFLAMVRQSYDDMFHGTEIKASFTGGVRLTVLRQQPISVPEYVDEMYYEGNSVMVDIGRAKNDAIIIDYIRRGDDPLTALSARWDVAHFLVVTNDINRYTGEDVTITYAQGYDETSAWQFGETLIVGVELAHKLGLSPGDTVLLNDDGLFEMQMGIAISDHGLEHPDDAGDPALFDLYYDQVTDEVIFYTFTIAGIAESSTEAFNYSVFTPGSSRAQALFNPLDVVELSIADNEVVDEFRDTIEGMIRDRKGDLSPNLNRFFMDTSKLENIRNSRRMIDMLYPMAVAAALIIGGFLCSLQILQSSKEAALLRALGATKKKTRAIQTIEQAILSIVGLLIGMGAMSILIASQQAAITLQAAIYGGLYITLIIICGIISSWLATRRRALGLLQAKE